MVSGTAVRFGSSRFGLRVKPMQTGFTLEPIEGNRFGGETESQVKPNRLSEPLPSLHTRTRTFGVRDLKPVPDKVRTISGV